MIIDARDLPNHKSIKTDICIVGAGPAGIALAKQFEGKAVKVFLIESGGLSRDSLAEKLNSFENSGAYKVETTFLRRYFGGATNMWGGNSAPYDPIDFSNRSYVPNSQWPINYSEFESYYPQAQSFLQLESSNYEPSYWKRQSRNLESKIISLSNEQVATKIYQRRTLRFRKVYRQMISKTDSNITALFHGTVTKLEASENGKVTRWARVRCFNRNEVKVEAKVFILAAGNENARILLLSNDVQKKGLGNDGDAVGRYLMRHLNVLSGVFVEKKPSRDLSLYQLLTYTVQKGRDRTALFSGFQISDNEQRRNQILNYVAFLEPIYHFSPRVDAHLYDQSWNCRKRKKGNRPVFYGRIAEWLLNHCSTRNFAIRNWVEQSPDRENRVVLGQGKDELGLPKLRFHWGIGEIEKRTMKCSQEILNQAFQQTAMGSIHKDIPSSDPWPNYWARSAHFMGTTRMSHSPKEGVVDQDCKVHGIENLYIAGGSVLPVSGTCMVTYNFLALAFRLADHIKHRMSF